MSTTTINVEGMTCEHCVANVRQALAALPNVEKVDVNLKKAQAKVKSSVPLDMAAVTLAVSEAGYTVVGVV